MSGGSPVQRDCLALKRVDIVVPCRKGKPQLHQPPGSVAFASMIENTEPRLAELSVSAGQGSNARSAIVLCGVRFGRSRQILKEVTVYAAVSYAEISVSAIPPGGTVGARFADDTNRDKMAREWTTSKRRNTKTSVGGKIGGSLGVDKVSVGVAVSGGREGTLDNTSEEKVTLSSLQAMVRAQGDQTWTIGDHDSQAPLQGLYLSDEPLCIIECSTDISEIELKLRVPRLNFMVEKVTNNATGKLIELDKGKRKLIEILSAKAISRNGDALEICNGRLSRSSQP